MLKPSPSHALYEGIIYFDNPLLKEKISTRATLDTYQNTLRFEFDGQGLQYQMDAGSLDADNAGHNISNFFSQKTRDGEEMVFYVSFKFETGQFHTGRTYQVDGVLKESNSQ